MSPRKHPTWSWLAFGLLALAASASANPQSSTAYLEPEFDQSAEATRAYKSALFTLSNITAHPPSLIHDVFSQPTTTTPSLLSAFLPSTQGHGPIATATRIALKLRQQFFLFRWFGAPSASSTRRKDQDIRRKAIKVLDLLQHSAELGNLDALFTLAHISLFPPSSPFPSNPNLAYHSFSHHAELTGNASSQALLAFFHATGYADVVPIDQAQALLYYTFAAQGGHKGAQMALAYRYWTGITTVENCGRAVESYEAAADQAMSMFLSGPPGGQTLPQTPTRLSDLDGGVFGPGASVASTGLNIIKPAVKAGLAHTAGETWDDVLEYYVFNADRGETDFAFKLGKIYYQGSIYASAGGIASGSEGVGRVLQDFQRAHSYFLQIARQVWPRDPPNPLQHNTPGYKAEGIKQPGYAAKSAAYLGRMYLRGEGMKQDYAIAMMWFERGAEFEERECHNMLGIMLRDGLVPARQDIKKALEHFSRAAAQELAEAHVNLGKYNYYRGEFKLAITYFEAAVRFGSTFEAYFYLAKIHTLNMRAANQDFTAGFCATAVSFFKLVAERGVWDDDLLTDAEAAWYNGAERGKEIAILKWWVAAERGSEMAQNNLAYVLDQDRSMLRLTRLAPIEASNDTALLALTQWTRSAVQRNIDALVKVGDYYYHGLGVADEPEALRWEKAARYYQSAADTQVSALAMWNLGWMYENGVGVPQDFHLAKRHYDLALETNGEAYLPVLLSLIKLYARSFWYTLQGGKDGLNLWTNDEDKLSVADRARLKPEIDGSSTETPLKDSGAQAALHKEERDIELEDDGSSWYLGKAREEFHRRRQGGDARAGAGDEDPVQWARERRNAENERDADFGPEDYFDGAIRGGLRGEEEVDDFTETMLLVALCAAVGVLIYLRTRIVERARRREQEERQNQEGERVLPPGGDAAQEQDEWIMMH